LIHLMCMACHHANTADAKVCANCGAGLLRRFCPACHVINDASAPFCHACGGRLDPMPGMEPTTVVSRPSLLDEPTVSRPTVRQAVDTAEQPTLAMVEAISPAAEPMPVVAVDRTPFDAALAAGAAAPPRRTGIAVAVAAVGGAVLLGGVWLLRQSDMAGAITASPMRSTAPAEPKPQSTVRGSVELAPAAAPKPQPQRIDTAAAPPKPAADTAAAPAVVTGTAAATVATPAAATTVTPAAPAAAPPAAATTGPAAQAGAVSATAGMTTTLPRPDAKSPAPSKPKAQPSEPPRRTAASAEKPARKATARAEAAARADAPAPAAARAPAPPRPPAPAVTECTPTIEALGLCTLAPRQQGR
jgi:hypothetical protein